MTPMGVELDGSRGVPSVDGGKELDHDDGEEYKVAGDDVVIDQGQVVDGRELLRDDVSAHEKER